MKHITAVAMIFLGFMLSLTSFAKEKENKKVEGTEIQADETVLYNQLVKLSLISIFLNQKITKKATNDQL